VKKTGKTENRAYMRSRGRKLALILSRQRR